ncbi:MAG TPA: hypothetical protein VG028_03855 [Terriglobia bacterium]|nr:hypothetical protein [Terriglobia bacterium]
MQRFLGVVFTPEVLGWALLAVVGVFVFLLVRPRQQDAAEEFWLAFVQQKSRRPAPQADLKPDVPGEEAADVVPGSGANWLAPL